MCVVADHSFSVAACLKKKKLQKTTKAINHRGQGQPLSPCCNRAGLWTTPEECQPSEIAACFKRKEADGSERTK